MTSSSRLNQQQARNPHPEAREMLLSPNELKDSMPTMKFSRQLSSKRISTRAWNVYTPFSNGAENEDPKDYDWVYFNINTKSRNFYTETFVTYQGDDDVYTDADFNDPNYQHPLDRYMNDINRGTQKMLNIKQLVSILKECKRRYSASQSNHLFDSGDKIIFTTYLKEYYYDVNPENTSEEYSIFYPIFNTVKTR